MQSSKTRNRQDSKERVKDGRDSPAPDRKRHHHRNDRNEEEKKETGSMRQR